jgi:hypothetical protein
MSQSRHTAVTDARLGMIAQIVPVLKASVPVEVQLEFPLPAAEEPIVEPLAGNLLVGYAIERPEGEGVRLGRRWEHLAPRHCAELGLAPAQLRDRAVANLRTRRPDLSFHWYPDVRAVAVSAGGDLESGLVLDDAFLEKLAQDLEGDLVVAVPARDLFVASGTGHPDGIEKLRWVIDQIWSDSRQAVAAHGFQGVAVHGGEIPESAAGERPHLLLTRELLRRRGDSWDILR